MQSFKLPEFYAPWPARRNPHVDAARVHSKAWAQQVGILDAGSIWSERDFDLHDYALLCGYIHPEAPIPELNLMTDWNVWAFYVDDHFIHTYKGHQDRAAAKQYLDRVLVFMPVDLGPLPVPANPMERALADLWQRTALEKSTAWRKRIIESTRRLLEAFLWELDNKGKRRISNPIEYIEMRRQVGAALWSADLVEHAMFVEIPERIADTRPIQVLKDTFADGVHLRNDIFSYQREVVKQGEQTNAVLVVECFLGVDTQQAVQLVNDLLTSRLEQFEHTVVTELEPLFAEYGLTVQERANVLTYIRGLRDWQSGAHAWHIQTSRYHTGQISKRLSGMSGLGTSAIQVKKAALHGMTGYKTFQHVPYKKVGKIKLPEFYMPVMRKINPHFETAREHEKTWAREMGMFDELPSHPGVFVWDERWFDVIDLAFFSARAHPFATPEQLDAAVYGVTWGTYTDDYFAILFGRTHDLEGARACHARLSYFMPLESGSAFPAATNPVERGLADLWSRLTGHLSFEQRIWYRKVIETVIGSWVWEIFNHTQNHIPDALDYFEMRRKTAGSNIMLAHSRFIYEQGVPPEVYRTLTLQQLNNAAMDYACLTNDIFSYQREIEFEGDMHNAVLVIQNLFGCDVAQAIEIANDLMTARMKQFEAIVANEFPILFENFNLNIHAQEQLLGYVEELRNYVCGSLEWHIRTGRYIEAEFARARSCHSILPLGLGGLGTSAAHITPKQRTATAAVAPAAGQKPFGVSHLFPSFLEKPSSK